MTSALYAVFTGGKVYYHVDEASFPLESREKWGHWVGIAENVGHAMTYKILTDDTKKVICRSEVRPVTENALNLRMEPLSGEVVNQFVLPRHDGNISQNFLDFLDQVAPNDSFFHSRPPQVLSERTQDAPLPDNMESSDLSALTNGNHNTDLSAPTDPPSPTHTSSNMMPTFNLARTVLTDAKDLVGCTFLMEPQDDGQRFRAAIVECIDQHNDNFSADPTRLKFRCSINDDQFEEILTYQEIMDHINHDSDDPVYWRFKKISAHEGPLDHNSPSYQGSKYNVMVEWENGEITTEPLSILAADDPVACALYARDNGLLNTEGWKRFKRIAKREKLLNRLVNQAKLRSYRTSPKYKYGFEVPHDYKHSIDPSNGGG